jgi:hypothetical protein
MPSPSSTHEDMTEAAHDFLERAIDGWGEMTPEGTRCALDADSKVEGRELLVTLRFRPVDG